MKITDTLDEFYRMHRLKNHKEKTIRNYREILDMYITFIENKDIEEFDKEDIYSFHEMLINKGLSAATINTYLTHLKAYFRWLEANNYSCGKTLSKDIIKPKLPKKMVHVYNETEIIQIFDACEKSVDWISKRNKLIVALMLDSGLRQAEVTKIYRKDIDMINMRLLVHGKGNKDRLVPIGELTVYFLEEYTKACPHEREFLLVDRYGNELTCNAVKQLLEDIKEKVSFRVYSHALRHNFASNFLIDCYNEKGSFDALALQTLLGHTDFRVTENYIHYAQEMVTCARKISHLDKLFLKNGV